MVRGDRQAGGDTGERRLIRVIAFFCPALNASGFSNKHQFPGFGGIQQQQLVRLILPGNTPPAQQIFQSG